MDQFVYTEKLGRNKFAALCGLLKQRNKIWDFKFTEDRYCPVDAIVNIKGRKCAVEIKNINYIMDRYFIKKEKYNGIKEYCKKNNIKKAIYTVFVGQTVYAIDLLSIPEIATEDILFLQMTNVYGGEKIPTPCYRFPVKMMRKWKI